MTLFQKIRQLAESTDNDYLRRARDEGREIVGLYCSYVPEELIHAAGAIPYRMRGVGSEGTNLGDTWFSSANCSFVRRILDQGLKGGFDFLSGIVFMNGCDHNRRLYDNWRFSKATGGFTYMLFVPYARQKASQDQYVTELTKLKSFLEERYEITITDEALTASIALYNKKRALLTKIAETRRAARPSLTGTEFLPLMHAVVTIPVEDAVALLTEVLAEVTAGREVESEGKLRVIVTGSCVEELSHLELLEAGGALVVSDAICLGARHY